MNKFAYRLSISLLLCILTCFCCGCRDGVSTAENLTFALNMSLMIACLFSIAAIWGWQKMKNDIYKGLILITYFILPLLPYPLMFGWDMSIGLFLFFFNIIIAIAFLVGIVAVRSLRKMKKKRDKGLILIIYSFLLLFLSPFILLGLEFNGFQDRFIRGKYIKLKPTEIFKIKEDLTCRLGGGESCKNEYFVISNPPKDTLLIKKIVEEYNIQTITQDTLRKYDQYYRIFYQENECLTRNYEEGKPWPATPWWSGCSCPIEQCVFISSETQEIYYRETEIARFFYFYNIDGDLLYDYSFVPPFGDGVTKSFKIKLSTLPDGRGYSDDNSFVDSRDGNRYYFVKIGNQTWMAENLNYNASGSRCYNDNLGNCDMYGRLYDWNTAKSACPEGWHLPSDAEWDVLMTTVGGEKTAGNFLKTKRGWNHNGKDIYGFSAMPRGCYSYGRFSENGKYGYWWSFSEFNSSRAYGREMNYYGSDVNRISYDKNFLFSVRCLQD